MASPQLPMYSDAPLEILHTPKFETGKEDEFTREASHMVLSHNAFIRGFNSIYQQALRVTAADKADFVLYCLSWHKCVEQHHHYEETEFFPNVDKAAGKTGLMGHAVKEHAAFHSGMDNFKNYLHEWGNEMDGAELISILDSFKTPFYEHLKSEPPSIVALAQHSTADHPINILQIADAAGKKQLSVGFIFNILPVFLLNMETVEFEDGMWHDVFPPFKGLVKTIMTQAVPMWRQGQWRFAACGADGRVKQLAV